MNAQMVKLDQVTDSAVDAADSADTAVRALSLAVTRPVQKVSGLAAGITYGVADFKAKRSWRSAVDAAKEAAATREQACSAERPSRSRQDVTDVVTLQLPREREFFGVAHLVLGGLGARLDLTYDVLEDMTTAIDELLNQREATDDVTLTVTIEDTAITATVGPFSGRVADGFHAPGDGLGLRRVLETSVDEVDVSERDGGQWVELKKTVERSA